MKNTGKKLAAVLILLCLVPVAAMSRGAAEPAPEVEMTSGFTFGGLGKVIHPYWDEVGMGVINAATVAQSEALFENPSVEDVARQVSVLEGYVAQGLDGIVFGASDPGAFDRVVGDALRNDIPVITFDSDAPESGRLVYIGPDNFHSGYLAGQRMVEILGGEGKVAIQVGSLTALNALERIDGFKEGIAGTNIEIVTEDVDGEDAQVANANAEAILSANPDLDGFYGVYAYNGPAQARAVKAAGKAPGEIAIVCFDALNETIEFIEEGYIDSAIDHRQYNFGFFSSMILYAMNVYGIDDTLVLLGFDPEDDPKDNILHTPTWVITEADLAEYQVWHDGISEAPAEAEKTGGFTFGGLGKVIHPYWDEVGQGVINASEMSGSTGLFENPSVEDVARQVSVLEGYIAQGVDGIVFGASDPGAFDRVVQDAMNSGIPVITFDSDAPGSGRMLYIGPDNRYSGSLLGERMVDILDGSGEVAIQVGSLTALNALERIDGFKSAIDGSNIRVVAEDVDGEDAQVANANSEAILSSWPGLDGFYGVYAYNAPAQARAVRAAGKDPGEVKVVGFDALSETIDFMEDGWIDSVVDHRQYNFGYFGVMVLHMMNVFGEDYTQYLLGFDPDEDPEDNILPMPSYLISLDNLAEYQEWHRSVFGD